ncbi:MAG TPA: hypothetical protein PKE53_14470 [Flavobacteriales bacterium]|jgi:hypothetical protein|nr:hypothetical protein [Flavobacteriales bacterium]
MNTDPQAILAEFGIDLNGKDPAGQYQWKMLSLNANSADRQRLEKAWAAYVLDKKVVDLPNKSAAAPANPATQPTRRSGGNVLAWLARRWMLIGIAVIGIGALWLYLHDRKEHAAKATPTTTVEWLAKYEAIQTILSESGHDDEHHDEFVLLAEAAKSAIQAGQGAQLLERMNADLAAERTRGGPKRITELASHTAQWKIIVQALVMNKVELLDHGKIEGHHEGEL